MPRRVSPPYAVAFTHISANAAVAGGSVRFLFLTSETWREKAGWDVAYWFAAYVPAGTPAPVVARLRELLVTGTKSAAAKSFYDTTGSDAWTTTSEELEKFQAGESLKWEKVIRAAGIEPE